MIQLKVESHGVCTINDLNSKRVTDELNSESMAVRYNSLDHLRHVKCGEAGACKEIQFEQLVCRCEVDDEI